MELYFHPCAELKQWTISISGVWIDTMLLFSLNVNIYTWKKTTDLVNNLLSPVSFKINLTKKSNVLIGYCLISSRNAPSFASNLNFFLFLMKFKSLRVEHFCFAFLHITLHFFISHSITLSSYYFVIWKIKYKIIIRKLLIVIINIE